MDRWAWDRCEGHLGLPEPMVGLVVDHSVHVFMHLPGRGLHLVRAGDQVIRSGEGRLSGDQVIRSGGERLSGDKIR